MIGPGLRYASGQTNRHRQPGQVGRPTNSDSQLLELGPGRPAPEAENGTRPGVQIVGCPTTQPSFAIFSSAIKSFLKKCFLIIMSH